MKRTIDVQEVVKALNGQKRKKLPYMAGDYEKGFQDGWNDALESIIIALKTGPIPPKNEPTYNYSIFSDDERIFEAVNALKLSIFSTLICWGVPSDLRRCVEDDFHIFYGRWRHIQAHRERSEE